MQIVELEREKAPNANKQWERVYLTKKRDVDAMRRLYELMKEKCRLYIQQTTTTEHPVNP